MSRWVAVTDRYEVHRQRDCGLMCDPAGERVEYGMVMSQDEAWSVADDPAWCPVCYPEVPYRPVAMPAAPPTFTCDRCGARVPEVFITSGRAWLCVSCQGAGR